MVELDLVPDSRVPISVEYHAELSTRGLALAKRDERGLVGGARQVGAEAFVEGPLRAGQTGM